ncbi:MAG: putative immunity protein [Bacilli bacterium]
MDCALPLWQKHYRDDSRPQEALNVARAWLAGKIKLTEAKPWLMTNWA